MNPGGHEEVRASIPAQIFGSITQMKWLNHLRTSKARNKGEEEDKRRKMKMPRGEGDWGTLILI